MFRPIISNSLKIGGNVANNAVQESFVQKVTTGTDTRYADELIEKALEKGKYIKYAKPFGMLFTLLLTPTETGQELTPRQAYERYGKTKSKINTTYRPKEKEDDDEKGYLVRFGPGPESVEQLASDAAKGENDPLFGARM